MLTWMIAAASAQVYLGDGDPLSWEDLEVHPDVAHLMPADDGIVGVVGGDPVPAGDWDDAVAMVFNRSYVGCTGTLIAPDVVMTAEHCTNGITHVIVGTKNWYTDQGEVIEIRRVWNHPSRDIAVVKLEAPSSIPPRLIATDCVAADHLRNGAEVALVGFGNTDAAGNRSSNKLMEGYSYIEDKNCRNTYGCAYPGDELVQGGNNVNGCFGDSGGPLYLLTDEGDFVAGVASRVIGGNQGPCQNGTIYVRPDSMLTWMENKLGEELPRPVCNLAPVPTAAPIAIGKNEIGSTVVLPNDPDADNVHVFEITDAPAFGTATVAEDGTVTYEPDTGFRGQDWFTVSVTDDGSQWEASGPITADVNVEVTVGGRSAGGEGVGAGCGCSGVGGGSVPWYVLVLGSVFWRRR